jgi:tetratricopeptide (TPR) repeat protein
MVHRGVEKEKIDSYLDHAQKFIDKALTIDQNESEIYLLQGFLHQARIGVDPMSRGQKYAALAHESFEKAKALNPENPRIYYLMAMSVLNTPEMFGGGKKNALPLFLQAKEKFDAFKPASAVSPSWGAEHNQQMLEKCQS